VSRILSVLAEVYEPRGGREIKRKGGKRKREGEGSACTNSFVPPSGERKKKGERRKKKTLLTVAYKLGSLSNQQGREKEEPGKGKRKGRKGKPQRLASENHIKAACQIEGKERERKRKKKGNAGTLPGVYLT